MRYILMFLTGALAAMLANRGVAVFNDAVRPIMPEYREGRMSRVELAATTFGLSFGLVIGFGIPFSIMSPIILVHSLFLGTDIIGTFFPGKAIDKWYKDKESLGGFLISGICGGVYGVLLLIGLKSFVDLMKLLPVNVFDALGGLGDPVIYAFAVFPILAIAYEYGFKKGIASLAIVVFVRELVEKLGYKSPDGAALLVGLAILLIFAVTEKKNEEDKTNLAALFTDRVSNIKKNIPYIAAMGALYAACVHINLLAEGPQSLLAMKKGMTADAINISIARALSFVPLKGVTSLATGTFATDGFGFAATAGLISPNIVVAAIIGAAVISLEAMSLVLVAKFFDNYPGIRKAADNMRNAMSKLLEIAIFVGSMMSANKMFPGVGFLMVAGLYLLNDTMKKPIVKIAVGPLGAIITGILVNIMVVAGLYVLPKM